MKFDKLPEDQFDPEFIDKMMPFFKGLYQYYFRCETSGWENIPEENALFVGNHNGLLTWEVFMLFYAWYEKYGTSRRAVGLAHNIAHSNPLFSWLTQRVGAIRANPKNAIDSLKHGYNVMVYPGGEKESFRPYRERKIVDFYQRKGFIKVAYEAKVPIVPVASIGAHESYYIIERNEELAERLGLKKKYRLHGLPTTPQALFFLWCVTLGVPLILPLLLAPAAFWAIWLPLPSKMTFKVLEPIDVVKLWDSAQSEDENLQRIYDHVIAALQGAVTDGYSKRKFPVLG